MSQLLKLGPICPFHTVTEVLKNCLLNPFELLRWKKFQVKILLIKKVWFQKYSRFFISCMIQISNISSIEKHFTIFFSKYFKMSGDIFGLFLSVQLRQFSGHPAVSTTTIIQESFFLLLLPSTFPVPTPPILMLRLQLL